MRRSLAALWLPVLAAALGGPIVVQRPEGSANATASAGGQRSEEQQTRNPAQFRIGKAGFEARAPQRRLDGAAGFDLPASMPSVGVTRAVVGTRLTETGRVRALRSPLPYYPTGPPAPQLS